MASLASNSDSVEQTKKVYFYDDDTADNWSIKGRYNAGPFLSQEQKNEAEKKVKFIAVPVGESGPVDKKYLSGGSDELNKRAYLLQKSSLERGWYFPESGVKTGHLEQLTNDINENKVLAIVFDFDKTLQLFEGALTGRSKSLNECVNLLKTNKLAPKNWTSYDLATFILHDATDPSRIDNLMMTLQFAEHQKIPIFIITNNALPKNNQQGFLTDLFNFLGVTTVEKDFILGGGTQYPNTKYQVILDKVIPFAEGVEEERKRAFAEEVEEERKRATTGSSKTDSGETKSDEQSKETSSKSENVSKNPPSSSFGGSKKTKKRKFRKKKRKTKRKKSILKTRKKKKKKKKSTKRKY